MTTLQELSNKQKELDKKEIELKKEMRDVKYKILDELSKVLNVPSHDLSIGHWDCKTSPIGVCIYNREEDHYEDDCLYCHQPDERK